MPNINAAHIHAVRLQDQGSDPSAPAAGYKLLYCKAGGIYVIDESNVVTGPFTVGITQVAADARYLRIANNLSEVTAATARTNLDVPKTDHDHSGTTEGDKLAQANTHESPDTDAATSSLHHTIGASATQAAAGNHTHPSGAGEVVTINFIIDGGGSAITTGVKGDLVIDFACDLISWTLLADASGAIKIDIWRDSYANFPPTDADTICNGHEPEIAASGVKAQDTDLSDWITNPPAITAGQTLRFNVDSAATITRATLALKVQRT